jgi:serine/threonine-protein kinase
MRAERWRRIEELFHRANELPSEKRSAFLDEACDGDAELERTIDLLIRADDEAGDFIEIAIEETVGSPSEQLSPGAGQRIGNYTVTRELGRGGMGNVFLAERTDDEFRQQVAIKLMRGLYSRELLRRFRTERQILATLDHPNIARLLDGGTTDGGVPYVVMEYVDGRPIDDFCDRRKLSTEGRLELFRQVCSAVEFAHRNLVVHRDIKPGNILVTGDGVPKLLDFGIAKLLDPERGGDAPTTASIARVLTPEYASPEQVRGEPVSTASDVYSLGVLLYELLVGRRPYHLASSRPEELIRAVCEQEPERPSSATQPDRLRRRLAGDLDNIVLMALRKELERRYASVGELSEDLRLHLEGHPVRARGDTWSYRSAKFVRRHRISVFLVSVVAMLLVTFAGTMTFQAARIKQERDQATLEREKAEEVARFLSEVFRVADPEQAPGDEVTARELLDAAARRVESELGGQPELQASMMHIIGGVYTSLGRYDDAAAQLAGALDARERWLGEEHPDTLTTMRELAMTRFHHAQLGEALALAERVLDARRRVLGEEHPDTLQSMSDLALMRYRDGDPASYRLWLDAYRAQSRVLGETHPETLRTQLDRAVQLYDAAEPLVREMLEVQQRTLGDEHPDTLRTRTRLADHYIWFEERRAEAERLYEEALETSRRVLGEVHPGTLEIQNGRILLYTFQLRLDEAEQLALETLEAWRRSAGPDHPRVHRGLLYLGNVYTEQGRYEEARSVYLQALEGNRRKLADDHPEAMATRHKLAWLHSLEGRHEQAEALGRVVRAARAHRATGALLMTEMSLACFAFARGDHEQAVGMIRDLLSRDCPPARRLAADLDAWPEACAKHRRESW